MKFWGECVLGTAYLINRTPTKLVNYKTPYKAFFGVPPMYEHLKVFGYLCYAYNHAKPRDKFDARATKCIFLGYPRGKKGWLLYDLEHHKLLVSRDVKFYEKIFPFEQEVEMSLKAPNNIHPTIKVALRKTALHPR